MVKALSVPGIYENVTRPNSFIGKYSDVSGHYHELKADGCFQFVTTRNRPFEWSRFCDHLSRLKQGKNHKKVAERKRRSL